MTQSIELPPGQQWVAQGKWPLMGERAPRDHDGPWQVELRGAVMQPRTFSLSDLQAMPRRELTIDVHCVTRWSKPQVRFAGVPLAALMEIAVPHPAARFVSFLARSTRGHSTSLPLAEAISLDALVALEVDGTPLPSEHGGPVRMVVPNRYFYKSLKWLECLELLEADRLGYWEATAGYHNTADPRLEQRYMAPGLSKTDARAILAARDISNRELRSLDARGHDLTGLVARGALLRDADFRGCPLSGACFNGANLSNAHFQQSDLREATFRDADLEGVNFSGADLRGAQLVGSSLVGASFCKPAADGGEVVRGVQLDRHTQFPEAALDELTPIQQAYLADALARVRQTG